MKRKFIKKHIAFKILGLLFILLLGYAFLWGPLLPWSPFKLGYDVFESHNVTIYYPKNTQLPQYYLDVNQDVQRISNELQLPTKLHITLIRTKKADLARYMPWMKTSGIGGLSIETGTVIYISFEQIALRQQDEYGYIKHELTHAIMHQHSSLQGLINANAVPYLAEGIPFYFGGPIYYPREEWLSLIKKVEFKEIETGEQIYAPETFAALDTETAERYKVSMMIYSEFNGYLKQRFGDELYHAFIKDYLKNPKQHREFFLTHFQQPLHVIVREFDTQLKSKAHAIKGGFCRTSKDCETPVEYLLQSHCPFGSACVAGRCEVVCQLDTRCSQDSDCTCNQYQAKDMKSCRCIEQKCTVVVNSSQKSN